MEIKIKYFTDIERIKMTDKGDWIDLRCAEDTDFSYDEFKLIPLGIAIQLPKGYEANIVPRSSLFKNYGLIQTNHFGVIDNSYRGDSDQWYFPALCLCRSTQIKKNDRICQFRIIKNQPKITFTEEEFFDSENRYGFGSTGII